MVANEIVKSKKLGMLFAIVVTILCSYLLLVFFKNTTYNIEKQKKEFDSTMHVRVPDVNKSQDAGGHRW